MLDYNAVRSVTPEEFAYNTVSDEDLNDPSKFTKASPEDIQRMERLLDVRAGTLANQEHFLERAECDCGRLLQPSDFVLTSLIDAGHSKSFVLHTFVGAKLIVNEARAVRCPDCGDYTVQVVLRYRCGPSYGCQSPPG
jgi:hypothetical protein